MEEFIKLISDIVNAVGGLHNFLMIILLLPFFFFFVIWVIYFVKAIIFKKNSKEAIATVISPPTIIEYPIQAGMNNVALSFFYLRFFCKNKKLQEKYKQAFKKSRFNLEFKYKIKFNDLSCKEHTSFITDIIPIEPDSNVNITYDIRNPSNTYRTRQHAYRTSLNFILGWIGFGIISIFTYIKIYIGN